MYFSILFYPVGIYLRNPRFMTCPDAGTKQNQSILYEPGRLVNAIIGGNTNQVQARGQIADID